MQERIIANSIISDESFHDGTPCWLWIGRRGANNDYGHIAVRKPGKKSPVKLLAHRVSYEAFKGPIPEGYVVQHLCNVQMCVAPLHLKAGTQSENMQQCVADGRHRWSQTRQEETV